MTDRDPYYLLGRLAATVEAVDKGYRTPTEAFDRIRELLVNSNYFESISPDTLNDSPATKVTASPSNISAPVADPAATRPQSLP
jgi:hypothetical protein